MDCWVQITSGRGPEECGRAVFHVMTIFATEAHGKSINVDMLEIIEGKYPKTIKSVLLSLSGRNIFNFLNTWEGTVQWIGKSPFRPKHKRKNWFIGISKLIPPKESMFSNKDLRFETMKASGPGGQHVNKSNTAVRVTHTPSGLVAIAREERSQHMNKKLALARLLKLMEGKHHDMKTKFRQEQWGMHNELERGNPVRIFEGPGFKMKLRS